MLKRTETGTWLPAFVPDSSVVVVVLLMACSMAVSTSHGACRSMMNGLNILTEYTDYFHLDESTLGVSTAAVFVGGCLAPISAGYLCDRMGRRPGIFWGCVIALAGMALQSASQNLAMFIVARIMIGLGGSTANIASGTYLSETFPSAWRSWGVSMLNNFFYVGALIMAVVTLATSSWPSTWAWRVPSIIQGLFPIFCIMLLPFVPESPRWLVYQDHHEAARCSVALVAADGDVDSSVTTAIYEAIVEGSGWEYSQKLDVSFWGVIKNRVTRRRLLIGGASIGVFSSISGNIIATYYIGAELKTAGITDITSQLKANIALNAFCLPCALVGTAVLSRWGRKSTAALTEILLVFCLVIIGVLSKVYTDDPSNVSTALIYANVAIMFLFQGVYSVAWTPLMTLYPPEVANYSIRAHTVGLAQFTQNLLCIIFVLILPIAFKNIGWKVYVINASWDVVIVVLIWLFWVETKGKTLEEINVLFENKTTRWNATHIEADARVGIYQRSNDASEAKA